MCAIDQGALRCPYRSEIQNGGNGSIEWKDDIHLKEPPS